MQRTFNKAERKPYFRNGSKGVDITAGELWTPAAISTYLWLDAADDTTITLNSGNVSQWNDKSGNNRHFTQGTTSRQPSYATAAQNGLNVIRPNADDRFLGINTNLTSRAFFIVYATESGYTSAGARFLIGDNVGQTRYYNFHGGDSTAVFQPSYATALQGSAATRVNGTSIAPFSITKTTNFSILSITQVNSGTYYYSAFGTDNYSVSARVWRGSYAEIVTLANNATQTETDLIEGYMAWKWGLVADLPAGHPYKDSPPML